MRSLTIQTTTGVALLAALTVYSVACDSDDDNKSGKPPATTTSYDQAALLTSVADKVILPTYEAFAADAAALQTAVQTLADAPTDAGKRTAAQAAFNTAIDRWQQAELMQVGPAGSKTQRKGGADLRDMIYSWPTANPCTVDQRLASKAYEKADFFPQKYVSAFGLDALENLLFSEAEDTSCGVPDDINAFKALTAEERQAGRAAYAAVVAAQIKKDADKLVADWKAFASQLKTGSGAYANKAEAMNELMAAIFYIDLVTKDRKLAVPTGIAPSCQTPICSDRVESRWAKRSGTYVIQNLKGLKRVLRGGDDADPEAGFIKALREADNAALADKLLTATDAAIKTTEDLGGSLGAVLIADPDAVKAVYAKVKVVNDLIKGEFATVLTLQIPEEGAGDSD